MSNNLETLVDNFIPFLSSPFGILVFALVYVFWVTCLLPGSWLSMLSGFLYGTWLGSSVVFVGAFIGAHLTFYLGRTFLKEWARKKVSDFPKVQIMEKAVKREGLKVILLTRLSPLFPFGLLNFTYGLSEVKVRDFTLGMIGILPGSILYCSLGSLALKVSNFGEVLSGRSDASSFISSLISILSTILVVILVLRSTRKLNQDSQSLD
ncbi:TVP38/TMEM64 family protein [Prochlorococcus marinus]|uniref:TVP38/TMEM64 family protein n=1 Tax=Prochlorococcus marinus TaxID=1219 RepID=UPI0039AEC5F6